MRKLLLCVLLSLPLAAYPHRKPPDRPLTPAERGRLISTAADHIDRSYVDPVKGKEIASLLRKAETEGKFASADSALKLVPLVNRALASSGDAHLRFGY